MELSSFLDKRLIFLDHSFSNYSEVIDFISEKMAHQLDQSPEKIKEAFLKRESLGTTYIGHHLALPHGYLQMADDIRVAFIRLDHEIQMDTPHQMIRYVFAIITARSKAQVYLKLLKCISELVQKHSYILDNAVSPSDLLKTLDFKDICVSEAFFAADLICCTILLKETDKIADAIGQMVMKGHPFVPVVDNEHHLLGIVDIKDLFKEAFDGSQKPEQFTLLDQISLLTPSLFEPVLHYWKSFPNREIREVMKNGDSVTISEHATYPEIATAMTKYHHRYLIVVDKEKKVKGMMDTSDILHIMIRA